MPLADQIPGGRHERFRVEVVPRVAYVLCEPHGIARMTSMDDLGDEIRRVKDRICRAFGTDRRPDGVAAPRPPLVAR